MQRGSISVQTENIFPIIKKFLYSDQEIFLRELVSNAVDATTKLKTLARRGEVTGELGDTRIEVLVNADERILTIRDRGIGMTAEEVEKYLNQVAFSSAQEFLEKYKDDATIIGHFGLGFYSAFMVADKVEVVTRSYKDGATAVRWTCDGNPEYTLEEATRDLVGTDVVLHIGEEAGEFLEESRIKELLEKYCRFLPIEIYFKGKVINNPNPIWKKSPTELTDEDYAKFYSELYPISQPALFWVHLNIDYPFNLTGILYFPKLNNNFEIQKNKIQLYSNQVYVTDNVKDIVPEFLTLLHGIIDSPDIPLNVSRSYLQSDRNVKKITGYITKKVSDKLHEIFKNNREDFESKWENIGTFVKYGMVTEEKFYEKALSFALMQNTEKQFFTLEEYENKIKDNQTDKNEKIVVLYSNNSAEHDLFIQSAKKESYDVLLFDNLLDSHFIQHLEYKNTKFSFVRVDADTIDKLIDKGESKESALSEKEQKQIQDLFTELVNSEEVAVELKPLSPDDQPVLITRPEFMRRMQEMQALQATTRLSGFPDMFNVIVNTNHPLVATKLLKSDAAEKKQLATYLYDLARLNQGMLKGVDLTRFIQSSLKILG